MDDLLLFEVQQIFGNYLMNVGLKSCFKQQFTPSNYPFNSNTPRVVYPYKILDNPGPGSYNLPSLATQKIDKYHINRQKACILQKQFEWMVTDERCKGLMKTDNNKVMGPGAYGVPQQGNSPKKSCWGKSIRFNRKSNNSKILPGPGSYDYQTHKENISAAQSAFKSRIPKLSNDSAHSELNKKLRIETEEFDQFEVKRQQQIQQIVATPLSKRGESSFVFSSKVPRFAEDISGKVGPGSYNLQNERHRYNTECPKPIVKEQKIIPKRTKTLSQVGPNSYNMQKYEMGRLVEFKGYAVTRETRFNFKHPKKNNPSAIPGPGQYMKNKYVFITEREVLGKDKPRPIKSTSLVEMKHKRSVKALLQMKDSGPKQGYNLNMFDIEFRLRQKLEHNQRLKIMEVSMPAFNSKVPRLKL